jgi:error-prone DNA polymerase
MVEGTVHRAETVQLIVRRCIDYTTLLGSLTAIHNDQEPVLTLSRADEKASPDVPIDKTNQVRVPAPDDYLDKGRNFK